MSETFSTRTSGVETELKAELEMREVREGEGEKGGGENDWPHLTLPLCNTVMVTHLCRISAFLPQLFFTFIFFHFSTLVSYKSYQKPTEFSWAICPFK